MFELNEDIKVHLIRFTSRELGQIVSNISHNKLSAMQLSIAHNMHLNQCQTYNGPNPANLNIVAASYAQNVHQHNRPSSPSDVRLSCAHKLSLNSLIFSALMYCDFNGINSGI